MALLELPYQPPTEVAPAIFQVPIPIPLPLRYVNCYLCAGPDGWTLVDTGFNDALAHDAWPRAFADLGIRPQDLRRILITHYHPDHSGGAGWLQQWTGAPVYLHEPEVAQLYRLWGGDPVQPFATMVDLFVAEGMPADLAAQVLQSYVDQADLVQPLPEITPLATDSTVMIGHDPYQVLWLPGHTDGLSVFYNNATGILFAGDMLLHRITPNVSRWTQGRQNPLADFLASLAKLETLGAKLALPGHRKLITDVAGRAREIAEHHAERLDQMALHVLADLPRGVTAWDLCRRVFPTAELTSHQLGFAMSEALAHLTYLVETGRLAQSGNRYTGV